MVWVIIFKLNQNWCSTSFTSHLLDCSNPKLFTVDHLKHSTRVASDLGDAEDARQHHQQTESHDGGKPDGGMASRMRMEFFGHTRWCPSIAKLVYNSNNYGL